MKKITILEFPSNLGLKRKESETEPGVKNLPGWLKAHGFHDQVNPNEVIRLEPPTYIVDFDEESGVLNVDKIVTYAGKQAKVMYPYLQDTIFQLIIGGDCSILIGSSLAFKKKGNYGLFFIDGHTDFMGPNLSQSGGAAGMDLTLVTGYGHRKLTDIDGLLPYFKEKNVFAVGNRETDAEYIAEISKSEIKYFDLKSSRQNGMNKTAVQFLNMVEKNDLDGFFIHLDVDVLHDEIMPAVDSRQKGGLNYMELRELLTPLFSSPKAFGMQITILDPTLDPSGTFTKDFVKNIAPLFQIINQ